MKLRTLLLGLSAVFSSFIGTAQCGVTHTVTNTGNPGEVTFDFDLGNLTDPGMFSANIQITNTTLSQYDGSAYVTQSNNPYNYIVQDNGTFSYTMVIADNYTSCLDSAAGTFTISNMLPDCSPTFTVNHISDTEKQFVANIGFGGVSGSPTYSWDFGDGNTATGQSVTHNFPSTHNWYSVTLTTSDVNCSGQITNSVEAGTPLPSCGATLSITPDAPLSLGNTFEVLGTFSGSETIQWSFGDGNSSTDNPAYHSYLSTGYQETYLVNVIVDDQNCVDTLFQSLTVDEDPACEALFTLYQDSINTADYNGYNYSTGSNLTYLWDFGDGNTSTDPFPTHSYNTVGFFDVCLTVDDGNGCSDTECMTIEVFTKATGTTINIMDPSLNITSEEQMELTIFPNPATTIINITAFNNYETAKVAFYDQMGRVVYPAFIQFSNGQLQYDINSLSEGIYYLRYSDNVTRFIKH